MDNQLNKIKRSKNNENCFEFFPLFSTCPDHLLHGDVGLHDGVRSRAAVVPFPLLERPLADGQHLHHGLRPHGRRRVHGKVINQPKLQPKILLNL